MTDELVGLLSSVVFVFLFYGVIKIFLWMCPKRSLSRTAQVIIEELSTGNGFKTYVNSVHSNSGEEDRLNVENDKLWLTVDKSVRVSVKRKNEKGYNFVEIQHALSSYDKKIIALQAQKLHEAIQRQIVDSVINEVFGKTV